MKLCLVGLWGSKVLRGCLEIFCIGAPKIGRGTEQWMGRLQAKLEIGRSGPRKFIGVTGRSFL
jgi:hypothetical protein